MKRALFIDRDGTLIMEPPEDCQVDSLAKLEFYPRVFRNLFFIQKNLDFERVMVTNQDGLGTERFPEDTFWPVQQKMLKAFENEGITFSDILIDRSLPEENSPNRKPRTGMLTNYLRGEYDLANSFVIGDRLTDMELAKNLGSQGILLNRKTMSEELKQSGLSGHCVFITDNWDEVYAYLAAPSRTARITRTTKETTVEIELTLDGKGNSSIHTGLKFFDHMLEQIGRHGGCDLNIRVEGDLDVDEHHTIEDTALALGEVFRKTTGDKKGMERYGFVLPMDDCLAQVAIDFGGRPWLTWNAEFKREKVGDVPTEMFFHFFKSFTDTARCNLNIKAQGTNEHHKIEAIFKAFAKAIKMAIKRDPYSFGLPSTKGSL
jgi:imidazoleglycerol-phosphate dehydratase / histidinol-phosphatase